MANIEIDVTIAQDYAAFPRRDLGCVQRAMAAVKSAVTVVHSNVTVGALALTIVTIAVALCTRNGAFVRASRAP